MSRYEQTVDFNLSESGVHPVTLGELIGDDSGLMADLLATELTYPHVNGIPELREAIAGLYEDGDPDHVLVTVGGIEANYLAVSALVQPGDHMVVMVPNYMQVWGAARNRGIRVETFGLDEARSWAPDLGELADKVHEGTKLIAVCNPNNPTGRILEPEEMETVVAIADSVGAWILADEVYRGAERLTDEETGSFHGLYDRVVAVGSMSKAYGLPGLRLGWAVTGAAALDDLWARHEYLTISATAVSNRLAAHALSDAVRPQLIERTRRFIRAGFPSLEAWSRSMGDLIEPIHHEASAVALLRYRLPINSTDLADRLRTEKSVLVVPGDHFGLDGFMRVSFGLPSDVLVPALDRIGELLQTIRQEN